MQVKRVLLLSELSFFTVNFVIIASNISGRADLHDVGLQRVRDKKVPLTKTAVYQ